MLVDISKITLENLYMYQINYRVKPKKHNLTQKEYQHKYYMEVTKPKRKNKRNEGWLDE